MLQSSSKAGRNEARKLTASALNNIGVAFALAGILQPALAFIQQDRWPGLAVLLASLIFILVAWAAHGGSEASCSETGGLR